MVYNDKSCIILLPRQNKNDASFSHSYKILKEQCGVLVTKKRSDLRVRQERESAVDSRVTIIITSAKSFKKQDSCHIS